MPHNSKLQVRNAKCIFTKYYFCYLTFLFSISGGGGCGKTYLMRVLSAWVEKIKRKHGDDPTSPKCLLLAPTGVASSLIGKNISLLLNRIRINLCCSLKYFRRNYFANWIRINEQRPLPLPNSRKIGYVQKSI